MNDYDNEGRAAAADAIRKIHGGAGTRIVTPDDFSKAMNGGDLTKGRRPPQSTNAVDQENTDDQGQHFGDPEPQGVPSKRKRRADEARRRARMDLDEDSDDDSDDEEDEDSVDDAAEHHSGRQDRDESGRFAQRRDQRGQRQSLKMLKAIHAAGPLKLGPDDLSKVAAFGELSKSTIDGDDLRKIERATQALRTGRDIDPEAIARAVAAAVRVATRR